MPRRALDTSHLIFQWRRRLGKTPIENVSAEEVGKWADELIDLHQTKCICTPVRIEFLCNTHGQGKLSRARDYLDRFQVVDGGVVTADDWRLAERFAPQRASDVKSSRSLGDCLIAAIYQRLNYNLAPTPQLDRDLLRRVQDPKGGAT